MRRCCTTYDSLLRHCFSCLPRVGPTLALGIAVVGWKHKLVFCFISSMLRKFRYLLFLLCFVGASLWYNGHVIRSTLSDRHVLVPEERCAILLFGLPRSFLSLVLRSFVKHVMEPNAAYQCDYFIHYFNLDYEPGGKTKKGGYVNSSEVLSIVDYVHNFSHGQSIVRYCSDTVESFEARHQDLINLVTYAKDENGDPIYFPVQQIYYDFPNSIIFMLRAWHSIQEVWKLMERHEREQQQRDLQFKNYTRVAVLRSDVVYMTPIDIYAYHTVLKRHGTVLQQLRDDENQYVIMPNFNRYPVNDRMIYGPRRAVQIWATTRFDRIPEHVHRFNLIDHGQNMHPERFVASEIIPHMLLLKSSSSNSSFYQLKYDRKICFYRARSDETVEVGDCRLPRDANKTMLEEILGRPCAKINETNAFCPKILPTEPPIV